MNNIRHISIFNELKLQSIPSGAQFYFTIIRNLSTIDLIRSKKYKIKNLSIDIGSSINNLKDVYFGNTRQFGFPIRFFLDDNPLGNEYTRLNSLYPTGSIFLNGNTITDNNLGKPTSIDIVDSSNVFYDGSKYYNSFGINQTEGSPEIFLQLGKTQTVAEYNFYNFLYSRIEESTSKIINSNTSNNDISDFYFDSKTFDYLCFSVFPYIKYFVLATPFEIVIQLNFTVNFDLEELN
jgi:hypothetical protein